VRLRGTLRSLFAVRRFVLCFIAFCSFLAAGPRGVEILWDRYGVAHVYAKDPEGLFFGYGYAQMQSHANLVLKLYGESRGRAAEYWGEKNLENDRWVLTNDVPERGLEWYRRQTPEFRRYLDAFAAGMNEYAARHPEAIDPQRRVVLPITGADPLIHVHRIVHFTYISSRSRVVTAATGKNPALDGLGSNAWAIAPSHTAGGHTLMLMNPHLPWMDWYTYYEAHLVAPGLNLYGASQIGFPVLRFVFTDYLGFTQTVNSIDGSDLYRLTLRDGGYVFDGQVRNFETSSKTIKIRQPDGSMKEEKLEIRRSVHGPVVWDKDGMTLAQRTAALDRPFLLEQYWKMQTAHTLAEYQEQLRRLEVPTFNITYGDRDGHVMYMFNGTLPHRKSGDLAYWAGIVPGDTSETLWTSVHSYDELPKVVDPPTGWVQNTNDPPWSATYPLVLDPAKFPLYTSGRNYSFRSMRSIRMLTENPKMSFDDLMRLKLSTRLELADRIVDDLIAAANQSASSDAKAAAAVLQAWDRQAENDSRGALLFQIFADKFLAHAQANFAVPQDYREPLTTPRGLADPAAAVRMLEQAAVDTRSLYGSLDAPWGQFMRLHHGATDLPANGAPGSLGAFRVLQYAPASRATRSAMFGDTFVALVEFTSPPHARVLLSYGNSSQPGSPHAEDQLPLLSKKQMRTAWRERKDVEANLESRDEF
jgi:acyl-homoserine-lactone acylase